MYRETETETDRQTDQEKGNIYWTNKSTSATYLPKTQSMRDWSLSDWLIQSQVEASILSLFFSNLIFMSFS